MLEKIRQRLRSRQKPAATYRPIARSKQDWDTQYAGLKWQRLRGIDELARYCVITGYCRHAHPMPALLDVGCGEGIWLENYRPNPYARYLGLDLSEEAVRVASAQQDERTDFVAADALSFKSQDRFDVVIFNECLYYFDEPTALAVQYESLLNPGGLVIVSMHETERSRWIWGEIERQRTLLESTNVTNAKGTAWRVACWRTGVSE